MGRVIRHRSIYVLVAAVVIFNLNTSTFDFHRLLERGWMFDQLPSMLGNAAMNPLILLAGLIALLVSILLTVAVQEDLYVSYRSQRNFRRPLFRRIAIKSLAWFATADIIIYVAYIALLLLVYLPAWLVWHREQTDLSAVVLIVAALTYPIEYASTAAFAMVSVWPISTVERLQALRLLARRRAAAKIYIFYALRILVETLLLGVLPFIGAAYLHSRLLAELLTCVAACVPFVVLRSSSYALKLSFMNDAPTVRDLFRAESPSTTGGRHL